MSNTQTRSEDGESGVTAVYCRVSKKSGNSRESGDSLANQAELAMRWIGQDAGLRGGEIRYFQDVRIRINMYLPEPSTLPQHLILQSQYTFIMPTARLITINITVIFNG